MTKCRVLSLDSLRVLLSHWEVGTIIIIPILKIREMKHKKKLLGLDDTLVYIRGDWAQGGKTVHIRKAGT